MQYSVDDTPGPLPPDPPAPEASTPPATGWQPRTIADLIERTDQTACDPDDPSQPRTVEEVSQ